ncbi:MAG: NAD-dependent epimerase/dehydratase family protein [Gaiellaceae bacterium]
MRIFLAGATGVIGVRLVRLLVAAGHEVAGMTRSPDKASLLEELGAEPVVCDVFEAEALLEAVTASRPGMVMHQLTDLPDDRARIGETTAVNARIRREGTSNLLAAARAAGAPRFIAQSVAWQLSGDGGASIAHHEGQVLASRGVVLRYGRFYGPGTYFERELPEHPRVHVDEAARRTVAALGFESGILTIADSEC